jgi:hypothetical protein
MAGGLIAFLVHKLTKEGQFKKREERGILFSSGLVAGDALVGVAVAFLIAFIPSYATFYDAHEAASLTGTFGPWLSLICFAIITYLLWVFTRLGKTGKAVSLEDKIEIKR